MTHCRSLHHSPTPRLVGQPRPVLPFRRVTSITAVSGMTWANAVLEHLGGSTARDAKRVTRQLGREPFGQLGQTWMQTRTILRGMPLVTARPLRAGAGRFALGRVSGAPDRVFGAERPTCGSANP